MERLNEVTGEVTNIMKRSYDHASELSTRMTNETTRAMEEGFGHTREFIELGMKAQKTLWGEWLKATETAKNTWEDMVHSYTKSYETKTPVKTAK